MSPTKITYNIRQSGMGGMVWGLPLEGVGESRCVGVMLLCPFPSFIMYTLLQRAFSSHLLKHSKHKTWTSAGPSEALWRIRYLFICPSQFLEE